MLNRRRAEETLRAELREARADAQKAKQEADALRSAVDPEALLDELNTAITGDYPPEDQYRDFRQLFLGSQQGKKVLRQILAWGHVWRTSMSDDAHRTAFKEGERSLALKLLATLHFEPSAKPTEANRKR